MALYFKVINKPECMEVIKLLELPSYPDKFNKNIQHVGPFLLLKEAEAARELLKQEGHASIPDWR